ncbi:aminoglycoside 3'-phosphotransferase/choline kinase family protein [Streptomyces sp. NPDC051940]|uniref:phosphotransferase family protein n=1 Tax=Streptomyces sp. NPDC051940 TaxID=3155675 RepID=UPI0034314A21
MLPRVETDADRSAVIPDERIMRPGATALLRELGLKDPPLTRFSTGSQPVYAVGDDLVLKLFPAASAQDAASETRALMHLHGRLPVPTPRVHAHGEYPDGWHYVLMSRLPGASLETEWPGLTPAARDRAATETGELLAALHAVDPRPLADVLGPGDWTAFTAKQRAGAVARQRGKGLSEPWLEQLPGFLAGVELPPPAEPSLLHTELMSQHLMTAGGAGRLTGVFDFEPAMIGAPAYDFAAVGVFVTRGDARLMGRVQAAYGRCVDPREIMAYTLLHVYSDLPWYLQELGAPAEPALDALAASWFGTAGDL